jgi:hypothetical protein
MPFFWSFFFPISTASRSMDALQIPTVDSVVVVVVVVVVNERMPL